MIIFLALVSGVIISIVLPLLKPLLPRPKVETLARREKRSTRLWRIIRPLLITGAFSVMASVIILALFGDTIDTWQKALLAGYTADSTLQKLVVSPERTS